jgi:predicted RNase H-like HicB family nuclease
MELYTVVLAPNEGSSYWTITCPAMPGCLSQGIGRKGALKNILEAMEGWLAVAREHGEGPIDETPELIAEEIAFVLSWKAEEGWPLLVETARVAAPELVAA